MKHGKLAVFGCNALALDVARRLEQSDHYFVMVDIDDASVQAARARGAAPQSPDVR